LSPKREVPASHAGPVPVEVLKARLNMTCSSCKQEIHMKNSKPCKRPKPPDKPPNNKKKGIGGDKARQVS
jgi:hypothetical protein